MKVVFLATYFVQNSSKNRIDLLLIIDQSVPTIEESLTISDQFMYRCSVWVLSFTNDMILCIFRLESLSLTPFFSLLDYIDSDFFCSIELMVFVASWSISFLI